MPASQLEHGVRAPRKIRRIRCTQRQRIGIVRESMLNPGVKQPTRLHRRGQGNQTVSDTFTHWNVRALEAGFESSRGSRFPSELASSSVCMPDILSAGHQKDNRYPEFAADAPPSSSRQDFGTGTMNRSTPAVRSPKNDRAAGQSRISTSSSRSSLRRSYHIRQT